MQPTDDQWKKLYDSAIAFKAAEPWNVLENYHIFAVKEPNTNRTGYCCVMGAGGELFGMALYLGTGGLNTLLAMFNDQLADDPLYVQHCLMLSFDDREDLHPNEREQIKALGLKFRGRGAWPAFKIHEPGFYPWPLQTAEDVIFLTAALEQAIYVAQAAAEDPDAYLEFQDKKVLTRVPASEINGAIAWDTEWLIPEEEAQEELPQSVAVINELQLAKLKKTIKRTSGIWELDCFFMPTPVSDEGRPYFPMGFVVLDQQSEQILMMHMFEQQDGFSIIPNKLLDLLETTKLLPAKLVAPNSNVFDYIEPIISSFDLSCYVSDGPMMMDEFKQSMFNQLRG
ncbi:hypothetical protein BK133_10115 [Paenibacillus sp. FSL H8-0548]|uniref:DUF7309 domain-containing protein n=1 Tax=Paenibacillus sp. FSL H8-0548 TaxID=1920422 RepID=UPI00096FBABF|nr:hypothetical protein [Paenibacillus sp. FSL H8-0548]OMF35805.1 hypothetical protein BK133_10115 [Paenibacillus sp. FSL H8-0548]